jgi:sec-independent protein translocase protein TatC
VARLRRVQHQDELSLVEHLDELRSRLIVSLIVLTIGVSVGFWKQHAILDYLLKPAQSALHRQDVLIGTSPTSGFFIAISISLYFALIVTLPVLTYQLYAFIIPAFAPEHPRRLRVLALAIPALFLTGAAFGWFVVVPAALDFLLAFNSDQVHYQMQPSSYIQFIALTMAAMGLIFEMPAIMLTLASLRIVTAARMRRTWRYAVVVLAVIAGVLPGADPVSFMAEFVPLLLLYGLSYLLVAAVDRRRARQDTPEGGAEPA